MALQLGGGIGNPGYSLASPKFNPLTGKYDPAGGPVWVGGAGSDPRGPGQESLQQFYNWYVPGMNYQVGANPQITDATAPGYNPHPTRQVSIGGAQPGMQQPPMASAIQPAVQPGGTALGAMGGTNTLPGMAQPGTGQRANVTPAAGPTMPGGLNSLQGGGMAQAIMDNPQALEQYWAQNPDALRAAIGGNPSMFAPTGLQRDGNTPPPTGLMGSEEAMYGGLVAGIGQLDKGKAEATGIMTGAAGDAKNFLQPYYDQGQGASQYQAALSGALGGDAQAAAFARYLESPEQAYLKEQSERALTRNAAATGGLRGGNVLKELQKNATGLAAQDFQNSFGRLEQTAGRGYDAGKAMSGIELGLGDKLGDLATSTGRIGADMAYGTGQALAGARLGTGQDMAANIGSVTSQLAQIKQQFGADVANQLQSQTSNLANLLTGMGLSEQQAQQQIAAMLANIATGNATTIANLPGIPGIQETEGLAGSFAKGAEGLGTAIKLSDRRLKRDIKHVGTSPRGLSLYRWAWVDGSGVGYGVMSDEVPASAVVRGSDGFDRVNYGGLVL
jgi:hypothetical protein